LPLVHDRHAVPVLVSTTPRLQTRFEPARCGAWLWVCRTVVEV